MGGSTSEASSLPSSVALPMCADFQSQMINRDLFKIVCVSSIIKWNSAPGFGQKGIVIRTLLPMQHKLVENAEKQVNMRKSSYLSNAD